jgi:hypothetical protein
MKAYRMPSKIVPEKFKVNRILGRTGERVTEVNLLSAYSGKAVKLLVYLSFTYI